jgi:predicted chitinase
MTNDDHLRFIEARQREFELSSEMADSPHDDGLWMAWLVAASAVDKLVENMDLSDEDVHTFDRHIQAVRSARHRARAPQNQSPGSPATDTDAPAAGQ